ncbi:MAG: topoisomerase [Pedosphaera sp.]|nr:topoisomerase [Pedosphaera sp.]
MPADPLQSAKLVGLKYVSNEMPGIRRESAGEGFRYLDSHGGVIDDPAILDRIKSLAIPPAWTGVWICPDENGHLQATGRDARRRKQHRYHPRWREVRDESKYTQTIAFAEALPAIRERVEQDLALPGIPRNKVLATVVRLLEVSRIRVGNEEYARENKSYGLTTMRDKHVDISGSKLHFHFRGKSGKEHEVDLHDRRLAKIVKACQDLPGQELFQYIDENGERRKVESDDVNAYLREITGREFTAKYFRTWAGTALAAQALQEFKHFDSGAEAKKNVVQAVKSVAEQLGNTPAVCRKCYVHPAIFDSYLEASLVEMLEKRMKKELPDSGHELRPEEAAVLALLKERSEREKAKEHHRNGNSGSPSGSR